MKILRIVSSGFEEGGVENGIVLLQPILAARGHIVKIYSSDTRPDLPHFNDYTFPAPKGKWGKLQYTFNLAAYRKLKATLAEFQPDVVHLHTIGHASPAILFALKKYPTIATVHGPEGYTKELLLWCLPKSDFTNGVYSFESLRLVGRLRYWYYRYINYPIFVLGLRHIDLFVSLSHYMQDLLKRQNIQSAYVPNATMLFDYEPLPSTNTLLFAGRLETYKGVDYLLRAFAQVLRTIPDAHLSIAGDGSQTEALTVLSHDLGIDKNVTFLGHISRTTLHEEYKKAKLIVVPSIWPEAFGKIGIEAMSVGRPVVASDVGGISDWLTSGHNGLLVPPKDASALSEAIVSLLTHPDLSSIAHHARKTAEQFDIEKHAARMEEVYKTAIQQNMQK